MPNFGPEEIPCATCSNIAGREVSHFRPQCSKSLSQKDNIAYSLKKQTEVLKCIGLREKVTGNDNGVWVTVERIPVEPEISKLPTSCKHGVDLRKEICTSCLGTEDIAAYDQRMLEELRALPSQHYYPYVGRSRVK